MKINMKKVAIPLFVCLFLFTCYASQASAYKRYYYCGKLNSGVYGITWGINTIIGIEYGNTVNYYDRVLYAVSSWNGINPTWYSSDDVSLSYTENLSSATLRFYVVNYGDQIWDGGCNLYSSNGNLINPHAIPGNWDYAKLYFNMHFTNHIKADDNNIAVYTLSDINAIAGHEIGHAFGLDDLRLSSDHNKLMWYKSGTYRTQGITSDEVNGIRDIY